MGVKVTTMRGLYRERWVKSWSHDDDYLRVIMSDYHRAMLAFNEGV